MTHHHHEDRAGSLDRRLWASAALNLGITLVELAGGMWAGRLALLADAAHNLADVGALGLAIYARRLGRRPPTPRRNYGRPRRGRNNRAPSTFPGFTPKGRGKSGSLVGSRCLANDYRG